MSSSKELRDCVEHLVKHPEDVERYYNMYPHHQGKPSTLFEYLTPNGQATFEDNWGCPILIKFSSKMLRHNLRAFTQELTQLVVEHPAIPDTCPSVEEFSSRTEDERRVVLEALYDIQMKTNKAIRWTPYEKGQEAYWAEIDITNNPYPIESEERFQWINGWQSAELR